MSTCTSTFAGAMEPRFEIPGTEVVRRIAVGGMGEVFLAERTGGGGERVVIKRLLPGVSDSVARLFAREREVLARVDHSNVIRLLDSGSDWLVLEYVDGADLGTILAHMEQRGRVLPLGATLAAIRGLALGLDAIHRASDPRGRPMGAVHRDVNPSNCLVSRQGVLKVADLGVVHVNAPDAPSVDGLKGTIAYMAPEQLLGGRVDARTDVYAAGLVAYEALAGVPARPAGMAGLAELLKARSALPAPPSSIRRGLPSALDAAVLAALEPKPEDRPTGAAAWLEKVLDAAGVEPDEAALGEACAGLGAVTARVGATVVGAGGQAGKGIERDSEVDNDQDHEAGNGRGLLRGGLAVGSILVAIAAVVWIALAGRDSAETADVVSGERVEETVVAPRRNEADRGRVEVGPVLAGGIDGRRPIESSQSGAAASRVVADVRVEIRPSGGEALYVTGGGIKGLAPRRTEPLGAEPVVLALHGGDEGIPAVLRLGREGDRVTAGIGAPGGRYYRVTCGGRDLGTTPVLGIRLKGDLRCKLADDGGRTMAFVMGVR